MKRVFILISVLIILSACSAVEGTSLTVQDNQTTLVTSSALPSPTATVTPSPSPIVTPFTGEITFRNSGWGMNFEQVKTAETEAVQLDSSESEGAILYKTNLDSLDTRILYSFFEGELYRASYMVNVSDNLGMFTEYDNLKTMLSEKYGSPIEDRKLWEGVLFKNSPESWDTAVATDKLRLITTWETDNTEIAMLLYGDGLYPLLTIEYRSVALYPKYEKFQAAQTKEKL
jgi:hypothetical protein